MSARLAWCRAWLGAVALGTAAASAQGTLSREQIAAERQKAETTFAQAQAECKTQFQVTDCMNNARAERRRALAPLQQQLNLMDDAKRRERAAQRLQMMQTRSAPASAAAAPLETKAARFPAAPVATPHEGKDPAAAVAAAAVQAHQRQAATQVRQQQAADHAQALQARNARQDSHHPAAAGLPVPQASAASR